MEQDQIDPNRLYKTESAGTEIAHQEFEEAYRRALDAHQLQRESLPALRDAPSQLDAYKESLLDWVRSLLNRFFPETSSPGISKESLDLLVEILYYAAIFCTVILAAYIVWRIVRRPKRRSNNQMILNESSDFVLPTDKLTKQISAALAAGRVSEAARLRWKLSLIRLNARPNLTPEEYYHIKSLPLSSSKQKNIDWNELLTREYELMFHEDRATRGTYDWIEGIWAKLEQERDERSGEGGP